MRTVLRMVLRVLFAAALLALPVVAAPPASALSCVMPTATNLVAEAPAAVVGRVIVADVDNGELTLAVDEVLKGGPFPRRLEVPGSALGWDDWNGPAMRNGPVLFSFYELDDGRLGTGACLYVQDPRIIAEARTLAERAGTTSEPTAGAAANPALAPEDSTSPAALLIVSGLVGAAALVAVTVLVVRRRNRLT